MDIYQITDTHTKKVVATGFINKQDAKIIRNKKIKDAELTMNNNPRFVVSRGTDHPDGPSNIHNSQRSHYRRAKHPRTSPRK